MEKELTTNGLAFFCRTSVYNLKNALKAGIIKADRKNEKNGISYFTCENAKKIKNIFFPKGYDLLPAICKRLSYSYDALYFLYLHGRAGDAIISTPSFSGTKKTRLLGNEEKIIAIMEREHKKVGLLPEEYISIIEIKEKFFIKVNRTTIICDLIGLQKEKYLSYNVYNRKAFLDFWKSNYNDILINACYVGKTIRKQTGISFYENSVLLSSLEKFKPFDCTAKFYKLTDVKKLFEALKLDTNLLK